MHTEGPPSTRSRTSSTGSLLRSTEAEGGEEVMDTMCHAESATGRLSEASQLGETKSSNLGHDDAQLSRGRADCRGHRSPSRSPSLRFSVLPQSQRVQAVIGAHPRRYGHVAVEGSVSGLRPDLTGCLLKELSPGSPRSSTATSTSAAATPSPGRPRRACGNCVTRTRAHLRDVPPRARHPAHPGCARRPPLRSSRPSVARPLIAQVRRSVAVAISWKSRSSFSRRSARTTRHVSIPGASVTGRWARSGRE